MDFKKEVDNIEYQVANAKMSPEHVFTKMKYIIQELSKVKDAQKTSSNSGDVKCLYGVKDCDNFGSKCNGCTPKYYKQITSPLLSEILILQKEFIK
jgi:hypothetical protein